MVRQKQENNDDQEEDEEEKEITLFDFLQAERRECQEINLISKESKIILFSPPIDAEPDLEQIKRDFIVKTS